MLSAAERLPLDLGQKAAISLVHQETGDTVTWPLVREARAAEGLVKAQRVANTSPCLL